jgi:hypothetical protein
MVYMVKELHTDEVSTHMEFLLHPGKFDCLSLGNTFPARYSSCWCSSIQMPEFPFVNEIPFYSMFGSLAITIQGIFVNSQ